MPHTFYWNNSHWAKMDTPLDVSSGMDRGLQFGDGVFETMRIGAAGSIPLVAYHKKRLERGLEVLGFSGEARRAACHAFDDILRTQIADTNAVKFIVTRGNSSQGYGAALDISPNIYLVAFGAPLLSQQPQRLEVGINPIRLAAQPYLAGLKHLNRLEQVLARQQFQPSWGESVMLDQKSQVVEGCMSNIFVKINQQWFTPILDVAGVDGVARQWLLSQNESIKVAPIAESDLGNASAVCFSNSLSGFRDTQALNGRTFEPCGDITEWQMHYKSLFDER